MKKNKRDLILLVHLMIITLLMQFPIENEKPLFYAIYNICILVAYVWLLSAWKESIHRRVIHRMMIMHADGIVFFMIFWIIARTLRYTIFLNIEPWERICWYMYYIPMIMIPLFCFMSARCLGQAEDWEPEKSAYIAYVPAALMVLGVLTNDYHQLAFKVRPGVGAVAEVYSRGPIYYCIVMWAVGFSITMIINLLKKCRVPGTKVIIWFPISALIIGSICSMAYVAVQISGFVEFSIVTCAVIILAWESCIWTGLIPSNTYYEEIMEISTVGVQIIDRRNRVRYSSKTAQKLSNDIIAHAKTEIVELDVNTRLRCVPIRGGHVLWSEDVSSINEILYELEEIRQNLEESNDLLEAEIALKQRKAKINAQNELYDKIAKSVERQLIYIRNMLKEISVDDELLETKFAIISILGAYIKRRTNLALLSEKSDNLATEELSYCIKESVECLRGCNIACSFSSDVSGEMNAEVMMLIYNIFQRAVEKALYNIISMLVNLRDEGSHICLKMVIEDYRALLPEDYCADEIAQYQGELKIEEIDGAEYVTLRMPKGGVNV